MFQLEFIELLKEFESSSDEYSKLKIKNSIKNLIKENTDNFNNFIEENSFNLSDNIKNLIEEILNEIQNEKDKKNKENINNFKNEKNGNTINDVSNENTDSNALFIRNSYLNWVKEFESNNYIANDECLKIVTSIINKYIENRSDLIEKILNIKDSNNYENFKNMLRNNIIIYISKKIHEYRSSDKYKNLNFYKKFKKNKQIINLYKNISKNNINFKLYKEIIED